VKQCLSHALTVREPYGVWGGMTEDERTFLLTGRRTAETTTVSA
ncbi:MAG: WhiB family transcriptional regulator, partial [Actinomycetales bacterium]|nr:WhiB family transcriptional regulator [Actinomycetales bacterium]